MPPRSYPVEPRLPPLAKRHCFATLDAMVAKLKALSLPTPVANNFLPATLKVVGPQIDQAAQIDGRFVKASAQRERQR